LLLYVYNVDENDIVFVVVVVVVAAAAAASVALYIVWYKM
jgi:hypothetical protein